MKNHKTLLVTLFIAFAFVAASLVTINIQSQTKVIVQQKSKEELPTVNLDETEAFNQDGKELRQKRGQKYNTGTPLKDTENIDTPEILELPLSHAPEKPALPIMQSNAVIIGTVTEARAFLSTDKSNVYSEFDVQIEETLKNSGSLKLDSGTLITIERIGGAVRFSSGKTRRLGNFAEGLPNKQTRYLLFLKCNEGDNDFSIITGYKLEMGKVFPLDGDERDNTDSSIFKNYRQYKNLDEKTFIQKVKNTLINPSKEDEAHE